MPGKKLSNSFVLQAKAKDGLGVRPNILRRTIFEDIDTVAEAWEFNAAHVTIDTAGDTRVDGRRSVRISAAVQGPYTDFQQNVYGRVKAGTWYTLSFYSFSTQPFDTYLYDQSGSTRWTDASEGCLVDGTAEKTALPADGHLAWAAAWTGRRHSVTFKTGSTFSTATLWVLFRARAGGQLAICMPKLEEGREATAYMPHEEDLTGNSGTDGTSPVLADLTNEHDGVACDSSGYTTGGEQAVTTRAQVLRGDTRLDISAIACKVDGTTLGTAYTASDDATKSFRAVAYPSTGTVTVYVRNGTFVKSRKIAVTVDYTDGEASKSRELALTISGSWAGSDGEPATIYNLMPGVDVVRCDDDYIPYANSISFKVVKTVGSAIAEVASWQEEGLTLYHNVGEGDISHGTVEGPTMTVTGIQSGLYYENSSVEWILKKGTLVVDREGIGTVCDGREGPDGPQGPSGPQGPQGPGGETYLIVAGVGSISIGANTQTATYNATISFYRKVGSAERAAYSCYCSVFRKRGSAYTLIAQHEKATYWHVEGLTVNAGTCDALVFCIYDSPSTSHSGYLAELEIPVYKAGDTGPTYWPSGNYDPEATYTKTAQATSLVFVEDESVWNEYAQAYGDYWYLTADTNVVGSTHHAPQDGSSYWARAENYGVVMVGAQFARFAKNGAGVMAGDYFYSANGRINGVERVDGQGADGNDVSAANPPAYTRFMGDPKAQNGYFNRNSLTGHVYSSREVLQTVYLARGVKLTVTIKGSTAASGTYYYFYVFKGDDYVSRMAFFGYQTAQVTLEYTAEEAGEYTVECYGSNSAVASFFASYEVTGHFFPNWWVDLKTGKMSGARDNFILDDGNITVNGALMSHRVKLITQSVASNARHELRIFEAEHNGLPVRTFGSGTAEDPYMYYFGLRKCRLLYDQVFIGAVGTTTAHVEILIPPPHLFVGQRLVITNETAGFKATASTDSYGNPTDAGSIVVRQEYAVFLNTYYEATCLTGQDASFEEDGVELQDLVDGKPYISGLGNNPYAACGIWVGRTISQGSGNLFVAKVRDAFAINEYQWVELTAVRGELPDKYTATQQWQSTMEYNAYWMLTRWEKKA